MAGEDSVPVGAMPGGVCLWQMELPRDHPWLCRDRNKNPSVHPFLRITGGSGHLPPGGTLTAPTDLLGIVVNWGRFWDK